MSAGPPPGRWVRVVTIAAVVVVATVAAVVSYVHMWEVAARAGEAWRAWLLPLSVDGLVVAASMVLLTRRRAGLPSGGLAWCALLGGVGASLAANIAAAEPTATARVVAAWPALAFAVAFELLLQQRRVPVADPVDALPVEAVDPVGEDPDPVDEDPPAAHPVAAELDDVDDPVGEPGPDRYAGWGEVDPLSARLAELIDASRAEGRPVGRRTVARELGVTEYRAGQLLARATTNGTTGGTS